MATSPSASSSRPRFLDKPPKGDWDVNMVGDDHVVDLIGRFVSWSLKFGAAQEPDRVDSWVFNRRSNPEKSRKSER